MLAWSARLVLGLCFSLAAGFFTFLVLWTIILTGTRSEMQLTVSIVSGVAGLAGMAAVPTWFMSGFSRRMVIGLVTVALLMGLIGGWVGFLVGTPAVRGQLVDLQTGEKIEFEHPVRELFTRSGIQAAWIGGAVAANVVVGGIYVFSAVRTRNY
jgi:hypothetical protein